MANYYQTVPEEEQNQMTGGEDDGCSWLLDNTLSQSAMPDQVDELLLIWNDMEETLRNKIDDEIRGLRNRVHHLLDERKMKCDFMLGITEQRQQEFPEKLNDYADTGECEGFSQGQTQDLMQPSTQPMMENDTMSDISHFTCDFDDVNRNGKAHHESSDSLCYHDDDDINNNNINDVNDNTFYMYRIMKALISINNRLYKLHHQR